MPKGLFRKTSGETGFTLVEVLLTVVILGIVLTLATLSYANISNGTNIQGAKKQLESAVNRAKITARQENSVCHFVVYPHSDAAHPNTYEFYHETQLADGTWSLEPFDNSTSGESVSAVGGHFYTQIGSSVSVLSGGTIIFTQTGTATKTSFTPEGGSLSIDLSAGNSTGKVVVNSQGAVTLE